MPSLLRCCTGYGLSPTSPDKTPCAANTSILAPDADEANASFTDGSEGATKLDYHVVFDDALLPGQLPGTPKLVSYCHEADSATGLPVLEGSMGLTSTQMLPLPLEAPAAHTDHGSAAHKSPVSLASLVIPTHIRVISAPFESDFRDGEQVVSHTSSSTSAAEEHRRLGKSTQNAASPPLAEAASSGNGPDLSVLRPEARLRRAVSIASGHGHLYKVYPVACTSPAADSERAEAIGNMLPGAVATESEGPSATRVDLQLGRTAAGAAAAAAVLPDATSLAAMVWQQLQQEVTLACRLPHDCPLLLLPYRLYEQPGTVHLVYGNAVAGNCTDLFMYLGERKRLPEASCRNVVRQVLQALSVLHAAGWVHRSISTEIVWVVEEPPTLQQGPLPATHNACLGAQQQQQPQAPERPSSGSVQPSTPGAGEAADGHVEAAALQPQETQPGPLPAPRLQVLLGGLAHVARLGGAAAAAGLATSAGEGNQQVLQARAVEEAVAAAMECGEQEQKQDQSHCHAQSQPQKGGSAEAPLRELVGCAYHLAPEAIRGGGYGQPADIWATGVLLYMMLTGRPPFPGANELEVMTRVLLATSSPAPGVSSPASTPTCAGRQSTGSCGRLSVANGPSRLSAGHASAAWSAAASAENPDSASLLDRPGPRADVSTHARNDACQSHLLEEEDAPDSAAIPHLHTAAANDSSCSRHGCSGGGQQTHSQSCSSTQRRNAQQQRDPLRELAVQAALESGASGACLEVLAGMLVADPAQRLSAAELLRMSWFEAEE